MTYDEVKICFEYHYPVVCITKTDNHAFAFGKSYYISGANLASNKHDKKKSQITVWLEENERTCFTVGLNDIKVEDAFEYLVERYVKDGKVQMFRTLLGELLENGLNQTEIINRVKKLIKIIKEQKCTEKKQLKKQ